MLITIIATILTALFNILSCHMLLNRKKSRFYCTYLFIGISIVIGLSIAGSLTVFGRTPLGKYIYCLLTFCYIFYYHLVFEESFPIKLFTMLSVWVFSNIILLIGLYTVDVYIPIYSNTTYILLVIFLRIFIQLGVLLFLFLYVRKPYKETVRLIDSKTFYLMCIYSLVTVMYLIENFDFELNSFTYTSFMSIVLFCFLVFAGYSIAFIAILSVSKNLTLKQNFNFIEKQLDLQRNNYHSFSKLIDKHSALKHDIRQHVLLVKSMIQTGNTEEAIHYIQKFDHDQVTENIPILCKHLSIDSFVKHYIAMALDNGVDFQTKLNIPPDINIHIIDLCVVLGNVIENAINACSKIDSHQSKYIELKCNILDSHFIIKIKNSYNGELIKEGNTYLSTCPKGQGIGIPSIISLAEKYNGHVDIQHTSNEFQVNIIMSLEALSTPQLSGSL